MKRVNYIVTQTLMRTLCPMVIIKDRNSELVTNENGLFGEKIPFFGGARPYQML